MEHGLQSDNGETDSNLNNDKDIQDTDKSLKRKSEHYYQAQNSKKPCLMLDMYTQTEAVTSSDNSAILRQIYDLVRKNADRLNTIEYIMVKLNQILPVTYQEPATPRTASDSGAKLRYSKKSSDVSVSETRQSNTSSTQSYLMSNSNPPPLDYVTQANGVGEEGWEEATEDHVMTSPIVDEEKDDTNIVMVKTKQEWPSDISPGVDQSSGRGCWLGDGSNVDHRVWFNGDPNIIARCEKYGTNPVRLALSLTEAMFSREEMAASNVRGTRGKQLLDPERIKAIREHIDFKFPLEDDRMDVRWQLIKPKLDSKCRSQRRIQREQKWKFERMSEKSPVTPRIKKRIINTEERETLLYGGPKGASTPLNEPSSPVISVFTESTAQFNETQPQ